MASRRRSTALSTGDRASCGAVRAEPGTVAYPARANREMPTAKLHQVPRALMAARRTVPENDVGIGMCLVDRGGLDGHSSVPEIVSRIF